MSQRPKSSPPPRRRPARLYKYRSMDERSQPFTKAIFRTNRLWYAQASSFNDPFDCNHHIDIEVTEDEWRESLSRLETRLGEGVGEALGALLGIFAEGLAQNLRKRTGKPAPEWLSAEQFRRGGRRIGGRAKVSVGGRRLSALAEDGGSQRLGRLYRAYVERARADIDSRYGVLSLSEQPDNILLWSHYGGDHRGICVEFDIEAHAAAFPELSAVAYRPETPRFTNRFGNLLANLRDLGLEDMEAELMSRIDEAEPTEHWSRTAVRDWFLVKSCLWEYEHEWRSIRRGPGAQKIPAAAISGVVLGCAASDETVATVSRWVARRRRKVSLRRAIKRPGEFALDLEPLRR